MFANMANPFVSLATMPTNAGGTAWGVDTLDLNFDAESLTDFASGSDKVVIQLQDTADMLHIKTWDHDGNAATPVVPVNYFSLGTDNSTISNTTTVVTTTMVNGLVQGTSVTSAPVTSSITTNDGTAATPDTYAEAAIVLSLGTDKTVGTTVNVTNATVNGVASTTSSANASTVDQVLTLETPAQLAASDFLLRVQQSATGQIEDFNVYTGGAPANQVKAQVQYTAANQSQGTTVDNLMNFDFVNDLVDFSKFNQVGLSSFAQDYDKLATVNHNAAATATGDGIQTNEILRVVLGFSLNGLNNNFAPDVAQNPDLFAAHAANGGTGNVLFVLEAGTTPSTGGLFTLTGEYHLFVDADHNGSYDPAQDMQINFTAETNTDITNSHPADALIQGILGLVGTQVTTDPSNPATVVDSLFMI
jgi:hypothetical protein